LGIPVHRMDIEVVANLARVQQEWAAIERAVGGGIGGVNRSLGTGERAHCRRSKDRFGEFGRLAESYGRAGGEARLRRQLQGDPAARVEFAIKLPALEGGGANLGAAQARAAAEAAHARRRQAIALVEQAAHRAAAGEGELTQETRMYLAAAEAARIEAERNAAELGRQAIAAERLEGNTISSPARRVEPARPGVASSSPPGSSAPACSNSASRSAMSPSSSRSAPIR
jgi:hypothetical protein